MYVFLALQKTDFRFISPKHSDALCPFAAAMSSNRNGEHSCQKKWIDLLFALAWNALMDLGGPERAIWFTMSGCIKTSTKDYWQYVLNDIRINHATAIKDMENRFQTKLVTTHPLTCSCTLPVRQLE